MSGLTAEQVAEMTEARREQITSEIDKWVEEEITKAAMAGNRLIVFHPSQAFKDMRDGCLRGHEFPHLDEWYSFDAASYVDRGFKVNVSEYKDVTLEW